MLELRGIRKKFGKIQALHTTDLVIERGKTTALLGPSGCGKSTLLRIIVGLVQADEGLVCFQGHVITPAAIRSFRHRLGYMLQDGGLFPHLSVRSNVTLLARHLRWTRGRIEQRLEELVQLTHLAGTSLDRYPAQISGGQRQRVALMRAMFLSPDLVLLDEPMGSLDPLIRSELQAELRQIFRTLNTTVVLVTHDISEAGFLADEIVLFKGGRMVQRGTLEQLVHDPQDPFVTTFINAQRSPLDSLGGPLT